MMYQEGHVDMLALKEILGHAHVSTTEIYTHLGAAQLKEAAKGLPFCQDGFLNIPRPRRKQTAPSRMTKENRKVK